MSYRVGIDLGGTSIKMALMNNDVMVEEWRIPTNISEEGTKIVPEIIESIKQVCEKQGVPLANIVSIGMGTPGQVDTEKGTVIGAYNLNWATTQFVKQQMEEALGAPFVLDNDANVAALGETVFGAGNNAKHVVMITLGTGVGAGVIVDGKIVSGAGGAGGEIGHICMDVAGKQCTCGNIGCLETITSATGVRQMALDFLATDTQTPSRLRDYADVDAKVVFDEAKQGDVIAQAIVEKFGQVLGLACSYVGNLLNPTAIVIGGGVAQAGEIILDSVTPTYVRHSLPKVQETTQLTLATLGDKAGVLGAVALAMTVA